MAELPHPWGTYAHFQDNLRRNYRIGDRSWGTEAGMDLILTCASSGIPPVSADISRAIATCRRRERFRASRQDPLPENLATPHPDSVLLARNELEAIRRRIGEPNWNMLTAVATGRSYKEISASLSTSEGAVRVKVVRLRRAIVDAA
jgi:hypothetical protein